MGFISSKEPDDRYLGRLSNPEQLREILNRNGDAEHPAHLCPLCERHGTNDCSLLKELAGWFPNGATLEIEAGSYCHTNGHCGEFELVQGSLPQIEERILIILIEG